MYAKQINYLIDCYWREHCFRRVDWSNGTIANFYPVSVPDRHMRFLVGASVIFK